MSQNNNQTNQQQEQGPTTPAKTPPDGQHNNPNGHEKQAPGYNETPEPRDQGTSGEVTQQDPAWRPGDEPAGRPVQGNGSEESSDAPEQSRGQGSGGSGF